MSSNAEFKAENATDIPVSSGAGLKRLFLDLADGFFKTKDNLNNVAPIATIATPFIHNPPVTVGMSPYSAAIQETVKVNVDTGLITVNLPTAVGNVGFQTKIVSLSDLIGPNVCTIIPFGIQTINGDASKTLTTPRERMTLESDGSNWLVVD